MSEISVIVAIITFNGRNVVKNSLESVLQQNYKNVDIIVIDDCSTDNTVELLDAYTNKITVIVNSTNLGLSQTLNKAVTLADNHSLLLLLQDDCMLVGNDWLSRAVSHFIDPTVGEVCGELCIPSEFPLSRKMLSLIEGEFISERQVTKTSFSYLKADLFRPEILNRVGGFDSAGNSKFGAEDLMIGLKIRKAGYTILKDPSLKVYPLARKGQASFTNLFKKEYYYGKGPGWAYITQTLEVAAEESEQVKIKIRMRRHTILFAIASLVLIVSTIYMNVILIPLIAVWSLKFLKLFFEARYNTIFTFTTKQQIIFGFVGILSAFMFSFGFFQGLINGIYFIFTR